MAKFLTRRIISLLLTLLIVSITIFLISEVAPGNIAINSLGNTITPDQEKSFNAQTGLDQPVATRYVRWLIGSDWQAARLIGRPLRHEFDPKNNRFTWWVEAPDGTLYQSKTEDGSTMLQLALQPDGSTKVIPMGDDVWTKNEQGFDTFWGVDTEGRAAMWVKGEQNQQWTLSSTSWRASKGAPRLYVPLMKGFLRGDPGVSFKDRRPVAEVLPTRIKNTAFLAAIAFAIVMPLALLLGLIAGLNEGKFIDRLLSILSLGATATPEFASGIFLILVFSTWLGWFPGAVVITSKDSLFTNPKLIILPVITLTLIELGYVLRITRSSMVEVMRTNYIRTATLKGLPRWRIVFKHALRNALMAPITIIILHVNWLIGGIVVVETLFGFPGLGRYILEAALFKDVFAIEAAAMLLVMIAVGTQLIADILYTYLNPRIRYS